MATVKITQLPQLFNIDANTSNTIIPIVNLTTGVTHKINATSLAKGLYSFNQLNVGNNSIILPNVIAQFSGNSSLYNQVNLQNFDGRGSGDFVVTANNGTDSTYFINMGINGSQYSDTNFSSTLANDGYLYVQGAPSNPSVANLIIGTTSSGSNIAFITGGASNTNIRAFITDLGLVLRGSSYIRFGDGTIQTSAASLNAAPITYTQSAFDTANSARANTIITQGIDNTQNNQIQAVFNQANVTVGIDNTQNNQITIIQNIDNTQNANIAIIQGVNLTQNVRIQAAFDTANISIGVDNTQNNQIQIALTTANNALANTTGTLNGNLTTTGDIVTLGNTFPQKGITYPITTSGNTSFAILSFTGASLVKLQCNTDLTLQLSNFTQGKTIDVVIDNMGNSTANIGHGCLANNSNLGTPNVLIPGQSSTHLKYISFGTTIDNAHVGIEQRTYGNTSNVLINNGVILSGNGLFQYTTSNNSTTTQTTNKSTPVTCNGRTGQITINSSSISKGDAVSFVVNNQVVGATDVIIVNIATGASANSYLISVDNVSSGSFRICLSNQGTGPLAETLTINFAILKVN